jgi:hypothetical protein
MYFVIWQIIPLVLYLQTPLVLLVISFWMPVEHQSLGGNLGFLFNQHQSLLLGLTKPLFRDWTLLCGNLSNDPAQLEALLVDARKEIGVDFLWAYGQIKSS